MGPSQFGVERFTVPGVLDQRAAEFPDRVLMSIAGTPVTFEQMRDRSCAAANALLDIGVGRGDTVALFTATCPEWVYFWLGAARIGAVTAAVNVANKDEFLVHALRLSRAKVVITDAERHPRLARGCRSGGNGEVGSGCWGFAVRCDGARVEQPTGCRPGRTRGRGGAVLHLGHDRTVESRRDDVALPVLRGRRGGGGLGTRRGRRGVERHAVVPPERRTVGACADAGRCDDGVVSGIPAERSVGRGARLRRSGFRRSRCHGLDALEPAAGSTRLAASAEIHLGGADLGRHVPQHRAALRRQGRDDVRHDGGVPDRVQGRFRGRCSGDIGTGRTPHSMCESSTATDIHCPQARSARSPAGRRQHT